MRILCVCGDNISRSPMFAELLREQPSIYCSEETVIDSAGYDQRYKDRPVANEWQKLYPETRIQLGKHKSRWLGDVKINEYSVILCMDHFVKDELTLSGCAVGIPLYVVTTTDGKEIEPVLRGGVEAYRECFEVLQEAARLWHI